MATIINAKTAGVGGIEITSDNTGNINLQSGGTTKLEVTAAGANIVGALTVNGAAPTYGKVLQVVSASQGDTSTTSSSMVYSGISIAITTTAANSRLLITMPFTIRIYNPANTNARFAIRSSIDSYATDLSAADIFFPSAFSNWNTGSPPTLSYLHAPNVASGTAITYRLYFALTTGGGGQGIYINDTSGWGYGGSFNKNIIMEIAA